MSNKPHILIAEDDEALAAILMEYLNEFGYQITWASRGDDALKLLQTEHFDIILSDIVMPGAGGLEVLAASCSDPIKTLVILMTGYSAIEDAIHAVEQGAYDYVSKPFQLPEIKVRIDNAAHYQSLLRKCTYQETFENFDLPQGFVAYDITNKPLTSVGIKAYKMKYPLHHV